MRLVTIEDAREHCKADGDDDAMIALYCETAESECARLANRSLFATRAEMAASLATIGTRMAAAYTAYDAAILNADAQGDDRVAGMLKYAAQAQLDSVTTQCEKDAHGLTLESAPDTVGVSGAQAIRGAVLMAVAHFYATRPAILTGQGAAAVEVPMGTADIMAKLRWAGPEYV